MQAVDAPLNCVLRTASMFLGSTVSIPLSPKSFCSNVGGIDPTNILKKRRIRPSMA